MKCDLNVSADDDLAAVLASAPEGAVVCLAAGTYSGPLALPAKVTLRPGDGVSAGAVVIDGAGGGPVMKLRPGGQATLEGLTLKGGEAEIGAGLHLIGGARLTLHGCTLTGLVANAKGGAIFVEEGELVATGTTFRGNTSSTGGAVAVEGDATARFEGCRFIGNQGSRGAAVSVHGGANVEITRTTFTGNTGDADLNVRGSMSQTPSVKITASILAAGIEARPASAVTVAQSAFGPDAAGFHDGAGNVQGPLALDGDGRPGDGSIVRDAGAP